MPSAWTLSRIEAVIFIAIVLLTRARVSHITSCINPAWFAQRPPLAPVGGVLLFRGRNDPRLFLYRRFQSLPRAS